MMRPKTFALLLATALLGSPAVTLATEYSFIEGGLVNIDRGPGSDLGFRLGGQVRVANELSLFGDLATTTDVDHLSAGLLFFRPIGDDLHLNLGGGIDYIDFRGNSTTELGLRAGLRWWAQPGTLELNPEVRIIAPFDDVVTSMRLNGLLRLNEEFSVQGAVQFGDDDRFEIGIRYYYWGR